MEDEKTIECEIKEITEEGVTQCITKEGKKIIIENPTPDLLRIKMPENNEE